VIKLKLEFVTFEDLQAFLQHGISANQKPAAQESQSPRKAVESAAPAAVVPPVDAPKKPGRPRKAVAVPDRVAATPLPGATPAPLNPLALTEGDVRAALMKVNEKHGANGLAKVAEVLAPFAVQRIGELKPEQYSQVIDAAVKVAA
jgi:hypothetical protein